MSNPVDDRAASITSPLLTTEDAASLLRVHPSTVRRLIGDGSLGVRRIGRSVRITRASLDEFIEAAR
jgi:excisionase family DNA binding protein